MQAHADTLKSIDLTRLPAALPATSKTSETVAKFEYSAREVSPPALLVRQLVTAHRTFQLHHGHSLDQLLSKLNRERFCTLLERYWTRYCRDWEVLLHGNPTVDVFGGLKLSSGGELGIGVGEEDWGSGERDVLEDLVRNTEGMVDMAVSRFGEKADVKSLQTMNMGHGEEPIEPWIGCGHVPEAHDGVIFGGIGAISRQSLRDVCTWTQQIYTYGEYAYGIRDNPHRQRRKRQRRNAPIEEAGVGTTIEGVGSGLRKQTQKAEATRIHGQLDKVADDSSLPVLPDDPRPAMHDRVATHDHATGRPGVQVASHPGIPPPIVTAAEHALNKATLQADKTETPPEQGSWSGSSFAISDKWMKYLTLGLGSGKPDTSPEVVKRPPASRQRSTSSSRTLRPSDTEDTLHTLKDGSISEQGNGTAGLAEVEPMPDGHALAYKAANQQRQETEGYFLVGYRGDVTDLSSKSDDMAEYLEDDGGRIVLRTLKVERDTHDTSTEYRDDQRSVPSYESSEKGPDDRRYARLQVLVYVRRPFIYTFLFEQRTPALSMASFYRDLHIHLVPLHKSLLSSTSVEKVAQRIAQSHTAQDEDDSVSTKSAPYEPPRNSPVYDLVWDPVILTVHTSIPNIPQPGTLAAEGFGTTDSGRKGPSTWTRIEGLNVHSQILNTLDSTKRVHHEIERTSKTSRGWWVVWLRIPPFSSSSNATQDSSVEVDTPARRSRREDFDIEECRIAFLVRKASDYVAPKSIGSRVSSGMFGIGKGEDTASAASGRWGPAAIAGGIGIDARKYVEGLLSLNR